MKRVLVGIAIIVLSLTFVAYAEPPREGYVLMYADEFDGDKLNMEDWHYRNEGYEYKGGYNRPEAVSVKDGNLQIEFASYKNSYMGGGVITNFGLGYGYYETRSKLFGETGGLHSSFWTAGVNGNGTDSPIFNQSIELDFYEVDSNKPTYIAPNFHYWLGGHKGELKNILENEEGKRLFEVTADASEDYFISGCEYLPDRCIWYINGVKVAEVKNQEMYGRPNVWLTALANNELSGEIDKAKLPGYSKWDYFRYYSMSFKGENLVVNPSFDDNNRKDYLNDISKMKLDHPASWLEIGDETAINVETDENNLRTGTGSAMIGKQGQYEATLQQSLKHIPNGSYTAVFHVKNEDDAEVYAFVNDTKVEISKKEGFQKYTFEVEVNENNAQIGIYAKGENDLVYADDISFYANEGTDEFNRKVPIDSNETKVIPGEIVVDDSDQENFKTEGTWIKSSVPGYSNSSIYNNATDASATWNLTVENDGEYSVELFKVYYANSSPDAVATLYIGDKEVKKDVINLKSGIDKWHKFGTYSFKKGDKIKIVLKMGSGGGYLRADCARLVAGESSKILQNGLLLKIGDCVAYKNYSKRFIDPDNRSVVPYVNEKDRTLVPLRFISEALLADVSYSETAGTLGGNDEITIEYNGKTLKFATGIEKYSIDGKEYIADICPENKNGRTFVPLRILSEAFGKFVCYEDSGLIAITEEEILNPSELKTIDEILKGDNN